MEEYMMSNNELEQDNAATGINETKAEKFLRLAPPRVDKTIKALQSLQKLSVHGSYEYTQEQVDKMFSAIKTQLEECEAAFKPKENKDTSGFSF